MNTPNRGMRYRKSMYRKKQIRTFLAIGGIVLAVALILFLILGNLFSQKLDEEDEPHAPPSSSALPPIPADQVRQMSSTALDLSAGASKSKSTLSSLASQGVTDVSFYLNDESGKLLYRSAVANTLDSALVGEYSLRFSEFSAIASDYGIYLSGAFRLQVDKNADELVRWATLSESAVLISEALRDGINDIVLVAPDLPVEQYPEMLRLAAEIRALYPSAVIGFSLPNAFLIEPDAKIIDELAQAFDYLAMDLSQYGSEEPAAFAERHVSAMLYYLLRYKMRILIPTVEEASQIALQRVLDENSITNRMRLP